MSEQDLIRSNNNLASSLYEMLVLLREVNINLQILNECMREVSERPSKN